MRHYRPFQRQKHEASAALSSSLLPPTRAFAPVGGDLQTPLDQNMHSGWSFAHIAVTRADPTPVYQAMDASRTQELLPSQERVIQHKPAEPISQQKNTTNLPDHLKTGIETLSGLSLDDVQVHYNSSNPARVQALAYAQGTDIHVGPGQEQHLAHEAWHVVQQKQGRVKPTLQARGVEVNDDQGLEHEADVMGAKALQMRASDTQTLQEGKELQDRSSASNVPVQRVYGGLEYTEGGATALESYPGGTPPLNTAPIATATLGSTRLGFYSVDPANIPVWIGARRNSDYRVLADNRVKLTNDVRTAEWVIEGHRVDGLDATRMMENITHDIAEMFHLRSDLKDIIDAQKASYPGTDIVIAPDATTDLSIPGGEGLFIYRPDATSTGKVQITIQYENIDTIRKINELNASKYLTGSKIADGEDIGQVTGTSSWLQWGADLIGTSSFSVADTLLASLVGASNSIAIEGEDIRLTADDVGLIKLMVINDAMASNMVRHNAIIGQAQDKNIQRFFPKAERQTYVNAIAQANVPPTILDALKTQITDAAEAMAQLVWDNADPFALRVDETLNEMANSGAPDAAAAALDIGTTKIRHATNQPTTQEECNKIKDAVLGPNGTFLARWITRASMAYTDSTGTASAHRYRPGKSSVIRSMSFTPVAGAGQGAIYEFREREIAMSVDNTAEVIKALTALFNAS